MILLSSKGRPLSENGDDDVCHNIAPLSDEIYMSKIMQRLANSAVELQLAGGTGGKAARRMSLPDKLLTLPLIEGAVKTTTLDDEEDPMSHPLQLLLLEKGT